MNARTYEAPVRVGNWSEDIVLQEELVKDFLGKKEQGQLLLQRTKHFIPKPVNLSISRDGLVKFGDTVMVLNKSSCERCDSALSVNITVSDMLSLDPSSVPTSLAGSPHLKPTNRNTFVVKSPLGKPDGATLRFNEPFQLCMPSPQGILYLKSDAATLRDSSKKARHNILMLSPEPSFCTEFQVSYFDPRLRLEFEHHPVPANERVIIAHQKTNKAVALEPSFKLRSLYGAVFEVTCHTYMDSHKAETDSNHWMFVMEVPGSEFCPISPPADLGHPR